MRISYVEVLHLNNHQKMMNIRKTGMAGGEQNSERVCAILNPDSLLQRNNYDTHFNL